MRHFPYLRSFTASRCRSFSALSKLDQDIAISKIKEGQFQGFVTNRWSYGDAPGGGYLMMMAMKAAGECVEHPDPLSITAYYANKSIENEHVDLSVRILSKSRSTTTLHITMTQRGEIKSEYTSVYGDLGRFKGFNHSSKPALSLPARKDCLNVTNSLRQFGHHVPLFNELEVYIPKTDPFAVHFFEGKPGKEASLSCWVKLADNKRNLCLPSAGFFVDALPPPILNMKPSNWVPTFDLTVHFWAHPPSSPQSPEQQEESQEEDGHWVQTRFETLYSQNSILYTDAEVWSYDGKRLLATSRQLARIMEPRPDGPAITFLNREDATGK
jgi:hypothetical protein